MDMNNSGEIIEDRPNRIRPVLQGVDGGQRVTDADLERSVSGEVRNPVEHQ